MHTTDTMTKNPNEFRLAPPTAVECPPWCDRTEGHAYESVIEEDGAQMRYHSAFLGEGEEVTVDRAGIWRDGREELGVPHISVWPNPDLTVISSAESARSLAALLIEAAAVLEELQR